MKLESAICDLGVLLDNHLDMSRQVNNTCKSASLLAIHNIGKIRNYLDQPTAEKLIHAFVTSKIDFCNSLLFGLPKKQLDKLQRILYAAARIATKTKRCQHISPVLRKLHWLPVTKRIEFKINITMTYKVLNGMAPSTEPKSSFCIQGIAIGGTSSSDPGLWCSLFLGSYTYSLEFLASGY